MDDSNCFTNIRASLLTYSVIFTEFSFNEILRESVLCELELEEVDLDLRMLYEHTELSGKHKIQAIAFVWNPDPYG